MMTKKLVVASSLALLASAANADPMKEALAASDEATFREIAGSDWSEIGKGRFEYTDEQGKQIRVAFGAEALENDLVELTQGLERNQKQLATESEPSKIDALNSSIRAYERALRSLESAKSNEKAVTGTGVLNGCSVNVALTATFDPAIGMVDYGYAKIEAETQEFGPYGPGAGQVTLIADVDGYTDSVSSFMGGLSYITADVWGPPSWGCSMEVRATIVPACSVTGYRSVRWTSTCASAYNGVTPSPIYSEYHVGKR